MRARYRSCSSRGLQLGQPRGRCTIGSHRSVSSETEGESGFDQALVHSRTRLFRAALLFLGSREDAEDATQKTLVRALESRHRFRGDAEVYTWLYRILLNLVKDLWKHRARSRSWLVAPGEEALRAVREDRPNAEQVLGASQRDQAVRRSLGSLDPGAREIIVLRHYQEMSYEDIASVLAIPVGTVRSRLSAARERLRERLAAEEALR